MANKTGNSNENAWLKRVQAQQKLIAFAVTACASFVLITFCWPLTVSGFTSTISIVVRFDNADQEKQEFLNILADALRSRMGDSNLETIVTQSNESCARAAINCPALTLETVRDSLAIRPVEGADKEKLRIEFLLRGNGNEAERVFIGLFADDCCSELKAAMQSIPSQSLTIIEKPQSEALHKTVRKITSIVSQLEQDLSSIDAALAMTKQHNPDGPFRNAAHSRKKIATSDEVQQSLGSINISELRKQLEAIKYASRESNASRDHSMLTHGLGLKTEPIGGVPNPEHLVFIGILSTVFGTVVARRFNAFGERGFDDISRVASRLRIPVIATLPRETLDSINGPVASIETRSDQDWANRIVKISKTVLIGTFVFTSGFCLINDEVRNAFMVNPFHALSKMVWVFVGY